MPTSTETPPSGADAIDAMEAYRETIHENIEYDSLVDRYGRDRIDEYVQIMLDAICLKSETVRVDRAE